MDAVKLRMGYPRRIRADIATENAYIRQMQVFLREDHGGVFMREDHGGVFVQCSFIYGSSHHNQIIECWWSFLLKHCTVHTTLDEHLPRLEGCQYVHTGLLRQELESILLHEIDTGGYSLCSLCNSHL